MNHRHRGTSATAVTRSAHQCRTPLLAEPSPRARASGERKDRLIHWAPPRDKQADHPCRHGERRARPYDRPSRNVDRPKFEAVDGVPDEMTDATAQMQEEGEGAAEQHDLADPGSDRALNHAVCPGTIRRSAQPDHQAHGAKAQNYPGDAVGDRQHRRELRPIDLDVGRKRAGRYRRRIAIHGLVHDHISRSPIAFLISAMALPGFNPLGQVRVQLRMVWHR